LFILLCPFNPVGRANIRALAVAGCDKDHYGKIITYNFPKGHLVYGPSQVDALIDQDTRIAEQFTLWNQMGSRVERGKMIVLPMGGTLVYIQPVYIKSAAQLKIPELKRLIVSRAETVVMKPSLLEGFRALNRLAEEESSSTSPTPGRTDSP